MSATATLRPTEITDRALESRQLDAPPEIAGKYFGPRITDCYMSSRLFEPASRFYEPASRFYEIADRMWLSEIEDAAALLDLEDRLFLVEIEARTPRVG